MKLVRSRNVSAESNLDEPDRSSYEPRLLDVAGGEQASSFRRR